MNILNNIIHKKRECKILLLMVVFYIVLLLVE